jgi:hypothetical protein
MRFNLSLLSMALSLTLVTAAPLSFASHLSDPNAKKADAKDAKSVVARLSFASHLSDPNAKKADAKDAKSVLARMIGALCARPHFFRLCVRLFLQILLSAVTSSASSWHPSFPPNLLTTASTPEAR